MAEYLEKIYQSLPGCTEAAIAEGETIESIEREICNKINHFLCIDEVIIKVNEEL